jgi:hypothetical protein
MGIGFYRYEGFPLEQKIAWVRQGRGPGALSEALQALADLGGDFIESEQTLSRLVNQLGGNWEGGAATAAGSAMQRAAMWPAASEPVTSQAGTGVELQTESVERTRHGMPGSAPRPEYGFDDALGDAFNQQTWNLFDVQTNFDEQVAQRRAADQEANRILYEHESASRANLAVMPALPPAPRITAESTPPATDRSTDDRPPGVSDDQQDPLGRKDNVTDQKQPDRNGEQNQEHRNQDQKQDVKQDQRQDPRQNPQHQQNPQQQQQQNPQQHKQELPQDPRQDVRPPETPRRDGVDLSAHVPALDPQQLSGQQAHPGSQSGQRAAGLGGFGGTGFPGGGLAAGGFAGGGGAAGPSTGSPTRGPGAGAGVGRVAPGGGTSGPVRGAPGAGRGPGGGSLMQPAVGGQSADSEDGEHSDKYWTHSDELFRTDDILVIGHGVIGEEPGRQS